MKVIICGAGRVGSSIAKQLSHENNDITVIDTDVGALGRISSQLDLKTVEGFACHPTVLEEAGAADADMLIAVSGIDEVNMVACSIGKSIFKIPTKIARIRNQAYMMPAYQDMYRSDNMPIDVIISPEIEVAKNILNRFHVPGATESIPIDNSNVKIVGIRILLNSPVSGAGVSQLKHQFEKINAALLGIFRDEEFFIPTHKDVIEPNDELFLVADNKYLRRTLEILGHEEEEAHKVVIIGGGNIGLYLAKELESENTGNRIKIIELSQKRAEFIADQLDKSVVICGSALDEAILDEVNIAKSETVIAVTNDDEVNILSSILAKNLGAKVCFTLLNNHSFEPLMQNLGIDVTVNPRESTVSSILQYVRRGKIRSAHTLKEGLAEVLEAEIADAIGLSGKKLGDIEFPEDTLVGAVVRDGQFLHAEPELVLNKRDRLIIMSLPNQVKSVEDLFSVQIRFFG